MLLTLLLHQGRVVSEGKVFVGRRHLLALDGLVKIICVVEQVLLSVTVLRYALETLLLPLGPCRGFLPATLNSKRSSYLMVTSFNLHPHLALVIYLTKTFFVSV